MIVIGLNEAIPIYIGKGFTKAPMPDRIRLAHEIGKEEAEALLPEITALLSEMDSIPVDWTSMDLNAATDHVVAVMRERHPELDHDALRALDWLYSWVNR